VLPDRSTGAQGRRSDETSNRVRPGGEMSGKATHRAFLPKKQRSAEGEPRCSALSVDTCGSWERKSKVAKADTVRRMGQRVRLCSLVCLECQVTSAAGTSEGYFIELRSYKQGRG